MDPELRQYLEAMEGRIYAHIDHRILETENRIRESEARLVKLITDVKESLEREMDKRFSEINARFETQANRLDRQAGLIQTGARWMNRHQDWAERIDKDLDVKSAQAIDQGDQMDKLRRRMDEMDRRKN